jgi:hypothetical protein
LARGQRSPRGRKGIRMTQQAEELTTKASKPQGKVFVPLKPRLGGSVDPLPFSIEQTNVLLAFADTLVPPAGDFPAPSRTGLLGYFRRYITRRKLEATHFPFISLEEVDALLVHLGSDFLIVEQDERSARVEVLSRQDEGLFVLFQALTYFAYYAQPEVVRAIQSTGSAGDDYHGPPQPYGYPREEPWDEATFSHGRGTYIKTEDVRPVSTGLGAGSLHSPAPAGPEPQIVPDLETGSA